jgi:hypothetical protein
VLPARGTGWAAAAGALGAFSSRGRAVVYAQRALATGRRGRRARAGKLGALAWAEATRGPTREEAGTVGRAGGRRERKGAAGVGRLGRKTEGNRDAGHFTFFFYFKKCFPFSFYLLHLIRFQICHKFKHMHQTKVEFRVQHDATFHTPLEFSLLDYNYK